MTAAGVHAPLAEGHWAIAALVALFTASVFLSTAATNVLAAVLCLVALAQWVRYRPWWLLRQPIALACIAFFAWLLLREALDGEVGREALQSVSQFRPLLFLVLWAPLFMAMRHRRAAVMATLVGLLLFMLTAVAGWATSGRAFHPLPGVPYPWDLPFALDKVAFRLFTRAPDLAGPLFLTTLFAAGHLALHRSRFSWALASYALLAVVVLFFATNRRTSQISFVLCVAFLVLTAVRNIRSPFRLAITSAAILGIVVLLSAAPVRDRMERVVSESREFLATPPQQRGQTATSTGGRLLFWSIAAQVAQESPWIGTAESAYKQRYLALDDANGGSVHRHANPHNEYLHVLGALGLIGLALYLAIHAGVVRTLQRAEAPRMQRLVLTYYLIAALSTALVNSLVIDMIPGHFHALALLVLGWFAWDRTGQGEPA